MPELPEVETVCRGLAPRLVGLALAQVEVRNGSLRWPVPVGELEKLRGQKLLHLRRRSKYLLFEFASGTLIAHLGMTGSFRFVESGDEWRKHDHVALVWNPGTADLQVRSSAGSKQPPSGPGGPRSRESRELRYHDPRRFGAILWQEGRAQVHPLLADLGPEPLEKDFTAEYLELALASRSVPIKVALMDASVVVGVGNIYASEACFLAGIKPQTPAKKVRGAKAQVLVDCVKQVLADAIKAGGTTFRDFENADALPGYFARKLNVYGREGEVCERCGGTIKKVVMGQRSTYWCGGCQK